MRPLKVLSMFDGISCGMVALERAEIPVEVYKAYEIDEDAIKISKNNYPMIEHCGDVFKGDYTQYKDFDLLIGGSPCFAEGTMIKTIDGFKEIQDIKIGDMVLTHTGTYKKVYDTMNRIADNYCIVSGENMEKIICTPNHPFYTKTMTRKYKNKRNQRLLSSEFSWTPVQDFNMIKNSSQTIKSHTYLCSVTDTIEQLPNYNGTEIKVNQFITQTKNNLNLQDENLWYIIGRYLGDGWIKYKYKNNKKMLSGIIICCGKDEGQELEEKIKATNLHYYKNEEKTVFRFTIINLELATYLQQFGSGAKNKHLIQDVYFLPKKLMECFLNGYLDADGCYTTSARTYSSVSKHLAYGIKYLINKYYKKPCGLHKEKARTYTIENRKVQGSITYSGVSPLKEQKQKHYFVEDNYIFTPYKKVEYINEPIKVYNFSVEEDESYTANGIVVHNCTYWSIAKASDGRETTSSGFGWELFSQYVRAYKESGCKYFLYENNESMSDDIKNEITKCLGVEPIMIDSADFSAQERKRYYWTNIPVLLNYIPSTLIFKDIEYQCEHTIYSFEKYKDTLKVNKENTIWKWDTSGKGYYSQQSRARSKDIKMNTLPASGTDKNNIYLGNYTYRKIHPIEAERLQTLPDNYTECVNSIGKRIKACGNGWTVDVITYILKNLKDVIE